ncbi:IS1595 family transposase [uncultured Imperialibacter sp.]|uniref:IS1595 family transposase n=1 Tax=uncultured Imperialibacter sp. TaxID=1672639 RepID=UPI0030DC74DC|tara:strand:+ start:68332 stop:69270 length:939 start_codon:yes stop_codon:yes gene_type:complete
MDFKSLPQLLDHFKEEKTCIEYYENIRWAGKPVCPHCDAEHPYVTTRGYKCSNNECYKKFTVKVGTIFENSKISLRTWFAAIWRCTNHKKGISSVQLSLDLGITQKTAWFVLHRVREMLKDKSPRMLGEYGMVEADEAYIGQREQTKHYSKRRSDENPSLRNDGSPYVEKKVIVGIIERNGKVVLKHVPNATKKNMVALIEKHVPKGAKIYTDESKVYKSLKKHYTHETVKHALSIYVAGDVHTNTIENFWSVLKRGLVGVYHQVSEKHLERYLDEFSARFNTRDITTSDRFQNFLKESESYLSHKRLIGVK